MFVVICPTLAAAMTRRPRQPAKVDYGRRDKRAARQRSAVAVAVDCSFAAVRPVAAVHLKARPARRTFE
jgi:hypothetical protein